MSRYIKYIVLIISILSITNCSRIYGENGLIQNRDTDYLRAKSIPPLKIPPGLSSSTIQSQHISSNPNYEADGKKIDLTPPELNNPGTKSQ